MKYLLVAVLVLAAGLAQAAPTVISNESIIEEIGSNTGNEANFFIYVSGGTTETCKLIVFPLWAAGLAGNDKEIHARAYSAALTAFSTGSKVVVTNYADTGCNSASKIKLIK